MEIEEKLQKIFRLRPLQDKIIVLRNECPEGYRKLVKAACVQEMNNLVNVEIGLVQTELKMPEPSKIPEICVLPRSKKLDYFLKEQEQTLDALEFINKFQS